MIGEESGHKIGDNDGLWVRISYESYLISRYVEIFGSYSVHTITQADSGVLPTYQEIR